MKNKILEIYSSFIAFFLNFLLYNKKSKENLITINSTNNSNFNHNSRYFFEFLILKGDIEVKFVLNNKKLKQRLIEKYGDHFITNYKIKDLLYILRSKYWITSTLELPIIEILKSRKRKVIHLGHGIPLKKIGIGENNISKLQLLNRKIRINRIDYFLSPSKQCNKVLIESFGDKIEILNCGQPRNDILKNNNQSKLKRMFNLKDEKILLYAPTWRPYDKTIFFPFNDLEINKLELFLEKNNIVLFLRPHPFFKHSIKKEVIELSRVKYLKSEIVPEIMEVLSEVDVLITDFSSIFFDYILTEKPVLFLPYDREKYEKEVGFTMNYSKLIGSNSALNYEKFEKKIKEALDGKFHQSKALEKLRNNLHDLKEKKSSEQLFRILDSLQFLEK